LIALADMLPTVVHEDGFAHAFDTPWLVESIARAATPAGHSLWWSEQVADSIVYYFRGHRNGNSITTGDISAIVRDVLDKIGAGDVAQAFEPLPPRFHLSLRALALQVGSGFELMFFNRLHHRLTEVGLRAYSSVHLYGLKPTVKYLCGRQSWRRKCVEFEKEILHTAHAVLVQQQTTREIQLLVT